MTDKKEPERTTEGQSCSGEKQGGPPARKSTGDRLLEAGCHPTLFYPTDVYDQSAFGFGGED